MSPPVPGGSRFDALILDTDGERRTVDDVHVPIPGRHNVQNALAAIAVALELGISDEAIVAGFERFEGVKRRFTKVGEADGAIIIDDYAHHPTEIRAVLAAAREGAEGRVIAVMQPHRYTRLQSLMDEFQNAFNDADVVFVTPVYAAGEEPIEGVDSSALWSKACAPTGTAWCARSATSTSCAASCAISPPKATWSSAWAPATSPNGPAHSPTASAKRGRANERASRPCRRCAGKLTPNAPLAPLVWFKSGGNGRVAVRAGGRRGSRRSSCASSTLTCR